MSPYNSAYKNTAVVDAGLAGFALGVLSTPVIVAEIGKSGPVVFANQAFADLFGVPLGKLGRGRVFSSLFLLPPKGLTWSELFEDIGSGNCFSGQLSLMVAGNAGEHIPVEVRFTPIPESDGKFTRFVAELTDLRARLHYGERHAVGMNFQKVVADIARSALCDNLTGLPNRSFFRREIEINLAEANEVNGQIGLIVFDLDNFKTINDTYGHSAGDGLLKRITDRMKGRLQDGEYLVRWGGDEFLWVIPSLELKQDFEARLEGIHEAVAEAASEGVESEGVRASVGYAVYPTDGTSVDDLIQTADIQMYRAKREAKLAEARRHTDKTVQTFSATEFSV